MVTPVEIQNKSFKSGGLGYDKRDVDNFMRDILNSYEELYRQNMELKDRVAVLNEGIQYYKTIEKTLQKALVLAEKTAEETRNNAAKEAKRIEKEATTKANIMLADAKNELELLHQQTITLIQQYEKYKLQFKNLANAQIEMLSSDAFSINIQNLDAFVSNPISFDASMGNAPKQEAPALESAKEEQSSGHLSDEDSEAEFDFSDYDLEGQEEFDFVDLNDND
jgi:cell division initiation protein